MPKAASPGAQNKSRADHFIHVETMWSVTSKPIQFGGEVFSLNDQMCRPVAAMSLKATLHVDERLIWPLVAA